MGNKVIRYGRIIFSTKVKSKMKKGLIIPSTVFKVHFVKDKQGKVSGFQSDRYGTSEFVKKIHSINKLDRNVYT